MSKEKNKTKPRPRPLLMRLLWGLRQFAYTLFNHREIIAELESELSKDFDIRVTKFHQTVNSIDATMESEFVSAFVDHMIQLYKNIGGENYLSMSAVREGELYEFIIQRKHGKTASELVAELKEEIELLKAGKEQNP
ncbi:MAG: hypothetical protein WD597_10080 [Balneolaceae bacterium]